MVRDIVQGRNGTDSGKIPQDHQILITIALMQPDARYEVSGVSVPVTLYF